jgi:hypothetical protein
VVITVSEAIDTPMAPGALAPVGPTQMRGYTCR